MAGDCHDLESEYRAIEPLLDRLSLAGVKRAQNIVRIEEKKDGQAYEGAPDAKLLADKQEKKSRQ